MIREVRPIDEEIVLEAEKQAIDIDTRARAEGRIRRFGGVFSDKVGLIGMMWLDERLTQLRIDHQFPDSIGRTVCFDMIIAGKRIEIKTCQSKEEFTIEGTIYNIEKGSKFDYLVYKDQHDDLKERGKLGELHGYGSVMVDWGFSKAAWMGWISKAEIEKYPFEDRGKGPGYCIPFSKLIDLDKL